MTNIHSTHTEGDAPQGSGCMPRNRSEPVQESASGSRSVSGSCPVRASERSRVRHGAHFLTASQLSRCRAGMAAGGKAAMAAAAPCRGARLAAHHATSIGAASRRCRWACRRAADPWRCGSDWAPSSSEAADRKDLSHGCRCARAWACLQGPGRRARGRADASTIPWTWCRRHARHPACRQLSRRRPHIPCGNAAAVPGGRAGGTGTSPSTSRRPSDRRRAR
jgi:hypothetical protein